MKVSPRSFRSHGRPRSFRCEACMGFLPLVDMYPLTWNTYSEAKKARFLAKMPGHGLVTGVVSSSAGHLLCAFDQFDTNTMWNIRLNPFRLSKSNINDNGERREYQARRLDVVGGHVVGGAGHPTTINYSRAVVQILAQNVHLVNVDNKVLPCCVRSSRPWTSHRPTLSSSARPRRRSLRLPRSCVTCSTSCTLAQPARRVAPFSTAPTGCTICSQRRARTTNSSTPR